MKQSGIGIAALVWDLWPVDKSPFYSLKTVVKIANIPTVSRKNTRKTAMGTIIPLKAPTPVMPTVGRRKNTDYRVREYLTEDEIAKLLVVAGKSRNPNRDKLLVLLTFRHALRVSELVSLQGGPHRLKERIPARF